MLNVATQSSFRPLTVYIASVGSQLDLKKRHIKGETNLTLIFRRGSAELCLKKHTVACDDTCPSNSQQSCNCKGEQAHTGGSYGAGYGAGYGGYNAYPQMPYQQMAGYNPYAQGQWHGRR